MKKSVLILAIAAILMPAMMSAQGNPAESIHLFVNKDDGRFAKGEQIVFSGYADGAIDEPLTMEIFEDGISRGRKPLTLTGGKSVIHECSYDRCMSVIVTVKAGKDKKATRSVGAVVAPEDYRPGFDEPRDFVKYWDRQKAQMRRKKPVVKREPVELTGRDAQKFDAWSIEISMHEGNPVRGYLVMPRNAQEKSLPIVIWAHSAGVNKPGNRASVKTALSYARRGNGAIALDMNAHGYLNDQPQSYYDDLYNGELKNCTRRPLTTREDYYFRLMYLRMVRAMDYLCGLPEWDGRRAVVCGGSQGGAQGVALAGLDSRVSLAVLTVPAHQDVGAHLQGRKNGWPFWGSLKEAEAAVETDILPYFDGPNFMRHTTAKIVFEAGLVDMTCPPGCVYASLNVCPSTDKTITTFPYRPHTSRDMPAEYIPVWKETIERPRDEALNEYLK